MATTASTLAADILTHLGQDFSTPAVDLSGASFQLPTQAGNPRYDAIPAHVLEDLTTGVVDGTGAFDKIMSSLRAHLQSEYEKGAITGDQYTKAYIELTTAALSSSLQYILQGTTSYWQALAAQSAARAAEIQAVQAAVELETAKHQMTSAAAQTEMLEAQHVLVQMQIASEDAKHQLAQAQIDLVAEQRESQRAQTMDTRTDGITPVNGLIEKQKALYTQQVTSYQRDAETKVVKMFVDAWITQKTLDEGLTAPSEFTNASLDEILGIIRGTHNLTV